MRSLHFVAAALLILATPYHASGDDLPGDPVSSGDFTLADVPAEVMTTPVRIEMLGDSATAGYGLSQNDALPLQLQNLLRERGYGGVTINNAGVSGDTSADGLQRVEWVLQGAVDGLILALGGNDVLRGLNPVNVYTNLAQIISYAQARDIVVMVAGMRGGNNLGEAYAQAFEQVYIALAREKSVDLYPFLLAGVALQPELNLPDGIHPNAQGVKVIANNMRPFVERMILRIYHKRTLEYNRLQTSRRENAQRERERAGLEQTQQISQQQQLRKRRQQEQQGNPSFQAIQKLHQRIRAAKTSDFALAPFSLPAPGG